MKTIGMLAMMLSAIVAFCLSIKGYHIQAIYYMLWVIALALLRIADLLNNKGD